MDDLFDRNLVMTSPPCILLILGMLCIAFGAGGVVEMILGLTQERFRLNVGVFFIPVGYGVLIRRNTSFGWLKFWHVITLRSEGYEPQTLLFTEDSEEKMTLRMVPIESGSE